MVDESRKLYFTYDNKDREGFITENLNLSHARDVYNGEVKEIAGEGVLEKVPDLITFIEECYSLLEVGGVATFTAPYYTAFQAWSDPRNIRGISQASLNFADKNYRTQNGCPDLATCDFEVGCSFATEVTINQRSEEAKQFWLARYNNVVQSIMFTLKKR